MSRRARLDKDAVVQAAVELIAEEGQNALTLNRLAARLGIQTPSLYNHVDGLPGLRRDLALLSTQALGERMADAALGKAGTDAVIAVAEAYRRYIRERPGLYMLSVSIPRDVAQHDPELGDAEARVVQVGLAVVASFGLRGDDALHAVRGLRSVVHGFATLEVAGGFGLPLDCDESFRRLVMSFTRGLQHPAAP